MERHRMSLILFLFYWIGILGAVILAGMWVWRQKEASSVAKGFGLFACVAVLAGFLWLAVGETWLADQKVKELCAKDGGVKIYEKVKLPAERFNQWGQILIPDEKNYTHLNDEYYYEWHNKYYEKNKNPEWVENHRDQSIEITRSHFKLYRKLDKKILGEAISYGRRGGGLSGSWAEPSFRCPSDADITDLNKLIPHKMAAKLNTVICLLLGLTVKSIHPQMQALYLAAS